MTDFKPWLILFSGLFFFSLVYVLMPVLTPFLVATLLAYLGDPMVDRLDKKIPRGISVLIVFVILSTFVLTLVFIFLPMVERELGSFIRTIPRYIDYFQLEFLPWVFERVGITFVELDLEGVKESIKDHWTKAGGVAAGLVSTVSKSGLAIIGWAVNLALIPVLTFYILRDWDIIKVAVLKLVPRESEKTFVAIIHDSDQVLSAFVRGQLIVMVVLGSVYSIGLWMVGLDFSLLIGMLAGIVSFVPYLGFIVGFAVAGIAAMVQYHDVFQLLPVLMVFGVGQVIESFFLTPLLVGDKIGLHPVAVMFAVMAGGQLFGFTGILLALPVAAVIMVLLRYGLARYLKSRMYTGG